MKKILALAAVAVLFPVFAHASCSAVKAQIDSKLQAKHISHYTLEVVPADKADSSGGKVVGSCDSGSKKIIYTRGTSSSGNGGDTPAASSSSGG